MDNQLLVAESLSNGINIIDLRIITEIAIILEDNIAALFNNYRTHDNYINSWEDFTESVNDDIDHIFNLPENRKVFMNYHFEVQVEDNTQKVVVTDGSVKQYTVMMRNDKPNTVFITPVKETGSIIVEEDKITVKDYELTDKQED